MAALSELKDFLLVINTSALIGAFVIMNWLRQQFASKGDFKELSLKVDQAESRLVKLEGEMAHLPDQGSIHRMELALAGMRGSIDVMTERMKGVAATGERLQEFLVDQAGKR